MGGERIEFVGVQLLSGNPGNAWVNLFQLQLAVLEGLPYRQKLKVPVSRVLMQNIQSLRLCHLHVKYV